MKHSPKLFRSIGLTKCSLASAAGVALPVDRGARLILGHGTHGPSENPAQGIIDCAKKYRTAGIKGTDLLNRVVSSTSASIIYVAPLLRQSGFDISDRRGNRRKIR